MPRRAANKDRNQGPIVETLRGVGAFVFDASGIGGGFPDLLVSFRQDVYLIEIKNPESWYGKKGMSDSQKRFCEQLRGFPIHVATTPDEALRIIGATE